MPEQLLAAQISTEKLSMGVLVAVAIIMTSYMNWRLGVKAALVAALFEGAIRKWGLPQGQEMVYFLKDVILFGAYVRFFFAQGDDMRPYRLKTSMGVLLLGGFVVALSALSPNMGSVILAAYGLKIYFYYIPLAFMMPYLFRSEEELRRNMVWFAFVATPICLLGFAQWARPGDSFLNVYSNTGTDTVATGFDGFNRVRITGTFSYLTGHVTFVAFFFALHVALLCSRQPKWATIMLICNLPLLVGNGLMSGSRGAILCMALTIAGFMAFSMVTKISQARNVLVMMIVILSLGGGLAMTLFPDAVQAWLSRAQNPDDTVQSRVVGHTSKSMGYAIKEVGMIGYGIGLTHPALEQIRKQLGVSPPRVKPPVYDLEMSQVYVELGMLGFLAWYGIRLWFLLKTYSAFKNSNSPVLRPLLLASLSFQIPHFVMSMVLNHTAGILIYAASGLALLGDVVAARGGIAFTGNSTEGFWNRKSLPLPVTQQPLLASGRPRGSRVRY